MSSCLDREVLFAIVFRLTFPALASSLKIIYAFLPSFQPSSIDLHF
jgi:hypothetical protein